MNPFLPLFVVLGVAALAFVVSLIRSIRIVPSQSSLVVERLGKYESTLEAGFHVLIPVLDQVRYTQTLKEQAVDVPSQPCFTQDNVRVEVDGVLYMKVFDPKLASYGINNYKYATIQLAQTTMRSVIGKLELDKTFEERERINASIVKDLDEATQPWGVKVTRYEIQNIRVPDSILKSMEAQMRAEREKRAEVSRSMGEMAARINYSIGIMEEAVNKSEGIMQKKINEAEGKASEIAQIAQATAESISLLANSMNTQGGEEAASFRISESYIQSLNKVAKKGNRVMLPIDLTDLNSVLSKIKKITST